VLDNQHLLK